MRRTSAVFGSILFLVVAPGTVAGLVPYWLTGWRGHAALPWRIAGSALILGALALLLECFGRFAWIGRGTPAPIAPTDRLVVSGPYRRVRNPIYVAVLGLILGQAALFGSVALLAYAGVIWTCFHLFVIGYEEPSLRRRFPADYARFFAAVPRWLPRLSPWRG
jgi:protein-S-isoprenylcysteine O-methyltransferase Ste14